jgi:serine/threonine-protein kinase
MPGAPPARPPAGSLERDIAAWLETIAAPAPDALAGAADTRRTAPPSTILPTMIRPSTGGRKALAVLEQLAAVAPGASAQLKTGETIGEGGMGVIRLAEQVALGRTVAVKTLKDARRAEPGAALDLLREAWVTGSLEHPNIVPVHHLGLDADGSPQIVLKRIEGTSWHDLLDDADTVASRFGAPDLLAWNLGILTQVLNAVRFAHSRGIVHRDLKPSNVMIGAFGEVYLLDWGIAVSLRDDGSGRLPLAADATEMAGTPCYMAPEMLGGEGAPPLSERTDVYLAGAVLFELITFRPPHDGATAHEVIASVVASRPALPPTAPPELAAICARAMAAAPADRYPSIEAMQAALAAYLEHRGSARLAARAGERLDELLAVLQACHADPDRRREEVYRLFGACRFGFHEALVAWRDNAEARAGLRAATIAVAEYELAGDDPRAAVTLLGEVEDAPPELVARARAAAADRASRQQALEALGRAHDAATGTRTRMFVTMVMGVLFATLPVIGAIHPTFMPLDRPRDLVLWSVGLAAVLGALGYWARESMRKTLINRRVFATGMLMFAAQIVLALGAWELGARGPQIMVLWIFCWFVLASMVTVAIDAGMAPSAVGFAIAFLVAARAPEHRYGVIAAANAVWRWRPASLRYTAEEQAARAAARAAARPSSTDAP